MTSRIRKHALLLHHLAHSGSKARKKLVQTYPKEAIDAVCDCAHNSLRGAIPLTKVQKQRLKKHKKVIRTLSNKKVSIKRKRKILGQSGGFLPILLKAGLAAIPGLLSLIKT